MVVGPGTEAIAGEGSILTAGGLDTHIHFICPQQCNDAIASGVTTMYGGGSGPATGYGTRRCFCSCANVVRLAACCARERAGIWNSGMVAWERAGSCSPSRDSA